MHRTLGPQVVSALSGGHRHHNAGAAGRMKKGRKAKVETTPQRTQALGRLEGQPPGTDSRVISQRPWGVC